MKMSVTHLRFPEILALSTKAGQWQNYIANYNNCQAIVCGGSTTSKRTGTSGNRVHAEGSTLKAGQKSPAIIREKVEVKGTGTSKKKPDRVTTDKVVKHKGVRTPSTQKMHLEKRIEYFNSSVEKTTETWQGCTIYAYANCALVWPFLCGHGKPFKSDPSSAVMQLVMMGNGKVDGIPHFIWVGPGMTVTTLKKKAMQILPLADKIEFEGIDPYENQKGMQDHRGWCRGCNRAYWKEVEDGVPAVERTQCSGPVRAKVKEGVKCVICRLGRANCEHQDQYTKALSKLKAAIRQHEDEDEDGNKTHVSIKDDNDEVVQLSQDPLKEDGKHVARPVINVTKDQLRTFLRNVAERLSLTVPDLREEFQAVMKKNMMVSFGKCNQVIKEVEMIETDVRMMVENFGL
ncbi:hypothetical protein CALCODRAFT_506377 [Calocera cornea HHB12733]|uniref:Uncharacterized protein n=1 Tax=Calocera cornea HHB12733 TaxID=1353952 RepID=A0A165IZ06_9BASI|nr:hypothetical protein CALCODRAFT_506377 [Calocera cornea HHB12733]